MKMIRPSKWGTEVRKRLHVLISASREEEKGVFFYLFRYINLNFLLECQCELKCVLQRKLSLLDLIPINVIFVAQRVFANMS